MNERILIVEDEAITALDLKYSLEDLMDIKLKGDMEGIEAAEVISELRIPIVYLTANTDTDTFEKSNVKGSYGFISKPYDISKLDKTLKITIKRAQIETQKINDAQGFSE